MSTEFPLGIFCNIPAHDYHARTEISVHGLHQIARSAAHYKYNLENKPDATPALRWGSLFDMCLFEPHLFATEVVIMPPFDRRSKDGKLGYAAFIDANAGKEHATVEEITELKLMREKILAHAGANKLLTETESQIQPSMFWIDADTGVRCRGRCDQIHPSDIIIDVKTSKDASEDEFRRDAYNYRYDCQAAFYTDGFKAITGREPKGFVFIVIESEAPYCVATYVADAEMIESGRRRNAIPLKTYAECMKTGVWPGYPEHLVPLSLPAWATSKNAVL